jgi:hypothetical protein
VQLVIFLHTFTAPCMCPKIDVMERECKKLEVGRDLNKAPGRQDSYRNVTTERRQKGVIGKYSVLTSPVATDHRRSETCQNELGNPATLDAPPGTRAVFLCIQSARGALWHRAPLPRKLRLSTARRSARRATRAHLPKLIKDYYCGSVSGGRSVLRAAN